MNFNQWVNRKMDPRASTIFGRLVASSERQTARRTQGEHEDAVERVKEALTDQARVLPMIDALMYVICIILYVNMLLIWV